jgi:G3E family GTPase
METPTSISKEQLTSFLETLKNDESLGIIIRSKGILRASDNDKWYYFDYVYGDYEIRLGNPDYTGRVVVIGSKIDEQKIENLFKMRG